MLLFKELQFPTAVAVDLLLLTKVIEPCAINSLMLDLIVFCLRPFARMYQSLAWTSCRVLYFDCIKRLQAS